MYVILCTLSVGIPSNKIFFMVISLLKQISENHNNIFGLDHKGIGKIFELEDGICIMNEWVVWLVYQETHPLFPLPQPLKEKKHGGN